MAFLLAVLIVVGVWGSELWLRRSNGQTARDGDIEDLLWMVLHLLAVPSAFGVVGWMPPADSGAWSTVAFFVVFDFGFYWAHRLFHQAGWWSVHRLHHTTKEVGTLSLWRAHLAERLSFGLVAVGAAWLTGAGAVGVTSSMIVALLVQAFAHHRTFHWAWLDRVGLVSPRVHRAHHWVGARWNYGHALIVWDALFRTLVRPKPGFGYACGDADTNDESRAWVVAGSAEVDDESCRAGGPSPG